MKILQCQKNEDYKSVERYLLDIIKIDQQLYGQASLNLAQVKQRLFENQELYIQKIIKLEGYKRSHDEKEIAGSRSIQNFNKILDLECCNWKLKVQIQLCEKEIKKAESLKDNCYLLEYFQCIKNLLLTCIQKNEQNSQNKETNQNHSNFSQMIKHSKNNKDQIIVQHSSSNQLNQHSIQKGKNYLDEQNVIDALSKNNNLFKPFNQCNQSHENKILKCSPKATIYCKSLQQLQQNQDQ
ncbi:hypothetical protein TTHERM_00787230 (macronuclear) [Tetrahymena thermophila SB210]|uniref:Kinase domain protein n=1 Tax=Tetrahymena thermophila (strain SB210) TaxID=312017 RepID=Q23ZE0_TETTS|nr:hypothetical protein TTHERM_00787230 [Tetrahymena thermophila SB210]EAS01917.2 hypothetical protein TTHERM_00787230 [Tetrahymena thermophila SB210]|eukprot:XP_001022162.2 hypothetical protein TTHERM_00787230 [Tetrahymena thermophila SB210]